MIKRIIGIDFGTSTSLIKIKNYAEEEPADQNPSSSQYVEFDGLAMVPTLIRVQEGSFYYGYDAQPERENSLLYSNFKMDLESPDHSQLSGQMERRNPGIYAGSCRGKRISQGERNGGTYGGPVCSSGAGETAV